MKKIESSGDRYTLQRQAFSLGAPTQSSGVFFVPCGAAKNVSQQLEDFALRTILIGSFCIAHLYTPSAAATRSLIKTTPKPEA